MALSQSLIQFSRVRSTITMLQQEQPIVIVQLGLPIITLHGMTNIMPTARITIQIQFQ